MKNTPKKQEALEKSARRGYDNTVVEDRAIPIDRSLQAEASSAHSRLNVPLNLEKTQHLPTGQQETVTWLHQHVLDEKLGWDSIGTILMKPGKGGGYYDKTVVYRTINGIYEGSMENVCGAIVAYRDLLAQREGIKVSTFAPNTISKLIWAALDYALAANGITEIIGESGQGKTIAAKEWKKKVNKGRVVYVECPVFGGIKGLLRVICDAVGANKNQSISAMQESIRRAFNPNRILIIDEVARILPHDKGAPPKNLDFFRWLHDQTRCGLALITTERFGDTLRKNTWMFEQLLGRIDMPLRLPRELDESCFMPLLGQYVPDPSTELKNICSSIVNQEVGGRMRSLDKLLKFACRLSAKNGEQLTGKQVLSTIKLRNRMMGEIKFAKK